MKKITVILMFISLTLSACKQKDDFVPLFNGKDLSGWEVINGEAPFTVEDGAIVGTCVTGTPNSFLCTEQEYGDFILTFEAKFEKGNSGVMFRAQSNPEYRDGRVHGYQMELDPSERAWTGGIYDEARRGWLYCMEYNQEAKKAFKLGEWNTYRIEAIGNSLRTFVNGVLFADLIDDVDSTGFIGLQVHSIGKDKSMVGQKNIFRNIQICTTNLEEHKTPENADITQVSYLTNKLSDREETEGWKLLWDGKTTQGWRGAKLETFPENGWKIADGILSVEKSDGSESTNGGDIVTIDKYENFILEVDFKITKGANSGIKYFVDTELNQGAGSSIGCEYQILDDENHPDAKMGKDGNRTLASLYDLITANAKNFNPDLQMEKRTNGYDWNRAKIIVRGDEVEHYLNGILVVKYNRSGQQWKDLVAKSKYKVWPNFGEARMGYILLQDHGDKVSFKNIKIKTL
jgi:3-keto-disaccharide hydrolase